MDIKFGGGSHRHHCHPSYQGTSSDMRSLRVHVVFEKGHRHLCDRRRAHAERYVPLLRQR